MSETKTVKEQEPQTAGQAYDREAKLKELLEQDAREQKEKGNAFADPFMGF